MIFLHKTFYERFCSVCLSVLVGVVSFYLPTTARDLAFCKILIPANENNNTCFFPIWIAFGLFSIFSSRVSNTVLSRCTGREYHCLVHVLQVNT